MTVQALYKLLKKNNIFLSGGAGVGKSYLTQQIIDKYNSLGKNVIPLGSTGISAVNIGGYTLHSFFIFAVASNLEELRLQDRKNKKRIIELKKILENIDLIVIDEISMVSAQVMDMIYYRLNSLNYSGKVLIVGDFYQLPPIKKSRNENRLFKEIYAFESTAWFKFKFKTVILNKVKRTNDRKFIDILSKIRVGICDNEVKGYLEKLRKNELKRGQEPTYLFGRNIEVEEMNREKLSLIKGDEALFFWQIDKLKEIDIRRIENWSKSLPVVNELHLKVGAPVIFTVNKWGKFVNGQRGIVAAFEDDFIVVNSDGRDIRVYMHDFEMLEIDNETLEQKAIVTISQFPLKLAYAVTIHKSQGMSLDFLVCNLDFLFAPNQLYVAISRAKNPQNLKIEYSRGDFNSYLSRVIVKNSIVENFYKGVECEN